MPEIWAGVDIGKEHHHCVVIDAQGERLLSRRVLNDESALLELIGDVLALSEDALWAVDINHGGAGLLTGLLLGHDQPRVYLTGLAVHQASTAYRGQSKTDAKDAFVIADQARMRNDLGVLRPGDEIAVDLKLLVRRRTDLVNDRTRQINRLREQLLEICPALERALSLTNKGPVLLLTGYQTPAAIRRSGVRRIETRLKNRKVKAATALAQVVVEAAQAQHTSLPGETLAASMVARLAKGVMALEEEIAEPGRAHRGPVSRAPARRGDPQPARHGAFAPSRLPSWQLRPMQARHLPSVRPQPPPAQRREALVSARRLRLGLDGRHGGSWKECGWQPADGSRSASSAWRAFDFASEIGADTAVGQWGCRRARRHPEGYGEVTEDEFNEEPRLHRHSRAVAGRSVHGHSYKLDSLCPTELSANSGCVSGAAV